MKENRYLYIIRCISIVLMLTACESGSHDGEFEVPVGDGTLIVELRSESEYITIDNIHIFVFNADDVLAGHHYFTDPRQVASQYFNYPEGYYTAIAVMNTEEDFMPPSPIDLSGITLPDFINWLYSIANNYPDIITGIAQTPLASGEVKRVVITLKPGTGGITPSTLRLLLQLPPPYLSDYPDIPAARAEPKYNPRCVVQLYHKRRREIAQRIQAIPVYWGRTGLYSLELTLDKGEYDLHLWTDYVPEGSSNDHHYVTNELNFVGFNPDYPYTACTDSRDAFYANINDIPITEDIQEQAVTLERPLAKYRLIASDYRQYLELVQTEDYPPLEETELTVFYEGFLPSSFNVTTGKPNDAIGGVSYPSCFTLLEEEPDCIQVGSDWVIVNDDSSVSVTIRLTGKDDKVISEVNNIRIPYRRGHLTTIRGDFLTSGESGGSIHIDTEWAGEYEIRF